jgi:hypothetical protein
MSQTSSGSFRKEKWYNKNIFPLVPVLEIKKADKHNTSGFSFRWLIFTFWSLDSFQFEVTATMDTHWGVGITFILPYLRGVIAIPCPEKIGTFIHRKLGRKCQ